MVLTHQNHCPLIATCCPASGMYVLSLKHPHPNNQPTALKSIEFTPDKNSTFLSNIVQSIITKPDLAMYYHQTAFSPVPSTFITFINNGFLLLAWTHSWTHIQVHPPTTGDETLNTLPAPGQKSRTVSFAIINPSDLISTDLTGHFPMQSSHGFNYLFICYLHDTKDILVRPMKTQSEAEHIRVYKNIF